MFRKSKSKIYPIHKGFNDKYELVTLIKKCDDAFDELELDNKYVILYYTVFTKSLGEYDLLCREYNKTFTVVDSGNGITYKVPQELLGKNVRFIRVRRPDDSKIKIAGDILGANFDEIVSALVKLKINHKVIERSDNRIVEILSGDGECAIYFPEIHFLTKFV